MLGLVLEVVALVVGLENLQVVSLLGVLPLMLNTGVGDSHKGPLISGGNTIFRKIIKT
jgi:hypothetical protein